MSATTPSWISTSRTMSSSVTGRRSSGSITCSSAFRTLVAIGLHAASVAPTGSGRRPPSGGEALPDGVRVHDRWPLLEERRPDGRAPHASREAAGRRARRGCSTGLAFLCGGLVSAAGFSIGWRHQAQRNTDAETALATATARHTRPRAPDRRRSRPRSPARARGGARSIRRLPQPQLRSRQLVSAATKVGADATASNGAGASVSSGAGALTATADRIASELKTLETYLTTTPTGRLDPGYIASQTGYLTRQLGKLQTAGGGLGASIGSFDAALRKLMPERRRTFDSLRPPRTRDLAFASGIAI